MCVKRRELVLLLLFLQNESKQRRYGTHSSGEVAVGATMVGTSLKILSFNETLNALFHVCRIRHKSMRDGECYETSMYMQLYTGIVVAL